MTELTSKSPDDPDDPLVTVQDVRALKLCMSGCRVWINTHGPVHGFTWTEFITNGYRASQFDATGDHLIKRVTDQARKRAHMVASRAADGAERKRREKERRRRG